jgi:hypothetical protein
MNRLSRSQGLPGNASQEALPRVNINNPLKINFSRSQGLPGNASQEALPRVNINNPLKINFIQT